MTAFVLKIGDRTWVAGLRWMSYQAEPTTVEILVDAGRIFANHGATDHDDDGPPAADIYFKRSQRSASVGEVSWHDVGYGLLPGTINEPLYSVGEALAALSDTKKWSATFELPDGKFLFVACADGTVDPSDLGEVVGDQATVEAAQQQQAWKGYEHSTHSYADLERALSEVTAELTKGTLVESHSTNRKRTLGAAIVAAVIVIAGGGVLWHVHEEHVLASQRQAMARLREQQLALRAKQTLETNPLLTSPAPETLLSVCKTAIESVPIDDGGWNVQSIDCTPHGVTVIWKATGTAWAGAHPPGAVSIDGEHVVWRHKLSLPHGTDRHMGLMNTVEMLRYVAGSAGVPVKVDTTAAAPTLPGGVVPPSAKEQYRRVTFSLHPSWAPWSIPFGRIPGLRIKTIRVAGFKWTVKGEVYGSGG